MAKNSSILILHGHGGYKNFKCKYNYEFVINFLCKADNGVYKMPDIRSISYSHNELVTAFTENDPYSIIEILTELKNKNLVEFIKDIVEEYHLCYADRHGTNILTPAMVTIKPKKFFELYVQMINPMNCPEIKKTVSEYIANGILICTFDKEQSESEAAKAKMNIAYNSSNQHYLSSSCPLFITPNRPSKKNKITSLDEKCNKFTSLSYRLELISKLKISFIISDKQAAVISVFINESTSTIDTQESYFKDGDGLPAWEMASKKLNILEDSPREYLELSINQDANIIWDACRVPIQLPCELTGSINDN